MVKDINKTRKRLINRLLGKHSVGEVAFIMNQSKQLISYFKRHPFIKDVIKQRETQYRRNLKIRVFKAYSKGKPKCRCCKEDNPVFLCIDHIDGGGHKHIKEVGDLYRWLVKNNFPKGFQVLCYNCNRGKWINGGSCPHKSFD